MKKNSMNKQNVNKKFKYNIIGAKKVCNTFSVIINTDNLENDFLYEEALYTFAKFHIQNKNIEM